MGQYGEVALLAVTLVRERGLLPPAAWAEAAARKFPDSESSRLKGCPKGAFLGLAGAGIIKGVPVGDYGKSGSGKNASYAREAAKLLREEGEAHSWSPEELWLKSLAEVGADLDKRSNSQMDVVLALHSNGLLT